MRKKGAVCRSLLYPAKTAIIGAEFVFWLLWGIHALREMTPARIALQPLSALLFLLVLYIALGAMMLGCFIHAFLCRAVIDERGVRVRVSRKKNRRHALAAGAFGLRAAYADVYAQAADLHLAHSEPLGQSGGPGPDAAAPYTCQATLLAPLHGGNPPLLSGPNRPPVSAAGRFGCRWEFSDGANLPGKAGAERAGAHAGNISFPAVLAGGGFLRNRLRGMGMAPHRRIGPDAGRFPGRRIWFLFSGHISASSGQLRIFLPLQDYHRPAGRALPHSGQEGRQRVHPLAGRAGGGCFPHCAGRTAALCFPHSKRLGRAEHDVQQPAVERADKNGVFPQASGRHPPPLPRENRGTGIKKRGRGREIYRGGIL